MTNKNQQVTKAGSSDSGERYRLFFEHATEAFALYELLYDEQGQPVDWIILEVNPAYTIHTGLPAEKVTGHRASEMFGEHMLEYLPTFARVVDTQTPETFETYAEAVRQYFLVSVFPIEGHRFAGVFSSIDERKQIEETLRTREREYRTLVENAPEVIARFDRQLRHTYVNEYGAKVYGVPREDVIGKTNAELGMPPDKVEYWRKHFEEVLATGEQQTVDFDFDSPNFGHQYFSSIFVPEFSDSGQVESVLAITRDVTELRQAEKALEDERNRLHTVLSTLPVGVFIIGPNGRIEEVNDAATRIWGGGMTPTRTISDYSQFKGWRADTGEPVKAEEWGGIRAFLKGETVDGAIVDIQRFDGTRGTILNSGVPIRDERGRIVGAVSVIQDITDLRLAEQALRDTEERLRLGMEATHLGTFDYYPQTGELIWSEYAKEHFGLPPSAQVDYEVFLSGIHPDDRERADSMIQSALRPESGGEYATEYRTIGLQDRKERWLEARGRTIFDDRGRPVRFIGATLDITERKRTEQALSKALDQARRDRERLEAMESIADAGISTTALDEVLDAIAERISGALHTHSCTILLTENHNELVCRAAKGIPEECGFRVSADKGFAGKILSTRRTVYVTDAESDMLVINPHIKRAGVRSILGTPMIARGEVVGIVYVNEVRIREYTDDERRLFETMASRTALVVENAKLYQGLKQSRDEIQRNFTLLQRTLLPPAEMQVGSGYRMAAAYLSPFGLEIGGDFYDVFDTEVGRHGIMIGDVAGKGIPAVSLATATRSTIRSLAYDIPFAGAALTHANAVLCPQVFDSGPTAFVTAFVATIDPSTGMLCYAGAGHPPPAIHRADGTVEFLETGNPPLRVVPRLEYDERSSCLMPGDKIILYTDGLSEARHGFDLLGLEGIQAVLEKYGRLEPEELVSQLLEAASDWSGGHLTDDTAILIIERTAEP